MGPGPTQPRKGDGPEPEGSPYGTGSRELNDYVGVLNREGARLLGESSPLSHPELWKQFSALALALGNWAEKRFECDTALGRQLQDAQQYTPSIADRAKLNALAVAQLVDPARLSEAGTDLPPESQALLDTGLKVETEFQNLREVTYSDAAPEEARLIVISISTTA